MRHIQPNVIALYLPHEDVHCLLLPLLLPQEKTKVALQQLLLHCTQRVERRATKVTSVTSQMHHHPRRRVLCLGIDECPEE